MRGENEEKRGGGRREERVKSRKGKGRGGKREKRGREEER